MINGRAGIRTSGFPPRPDPLLLDYPKAAVSLADLPCGVWNSASLKLALWPSPAARSVLPGLPHTHAPHPELLKGVTWREPAVAHSLPGGAREWRPIGEAPEPGGSLRSCGGGERMVMDEERSGGGAERTASRAPHPEGLRIGAPPLQGCGSCAPFQEEKPRTHEVRFFLADNNNVSLSWVANTAIKFTFQI